MNPNTLLIYGVLTALNSFLLIVIALLMVLQASSTRSAFLGRTTRMEETIGRLEKELSDLKAGSIIQIPPRANGPPA